jgi:TRAP-type mannitol/chloroaromatic compound transport system permease small subunit
MKLLKFWSSATTFCNGIGTLLVIFLMVSINADVLGRLIFNAPISGVTELASMSIVAVVFLQVAHCLATNQVVRSETLLVKLQHHSPRLGVYMDAFCYLLGAVLMSLIAYSVLPLTLQAYQSGEYAGVEGLFTIPTWPVGVIVTIGAAMTAFEFILGIITRLRVANAGIESARNFQIPGGLEL